MAESFCSSVAVNLVSKLGEYLFAPIGRQFGYVLCYNSYIEDLQTAVKELDSARERLQHSVDEAKRDIKPIYTDVQDWLGNVTTEAEEARHLLERGKSAENACFCGWIPNPLVRHRIGRKVRKTTEVIQGRLHEKRRNSDFKEVSYGNTPAGIVTSIPSNTRSIDKKEDALGSRALIMEDVMKALADDEVHVIGVYGLGGVGKSKLLADIKERVKGEKLFDEVAMADVSRDPDLKRIQGEIAEALGLKLMNVETSRGRANLLHQRLNGDPKKKILIILDNLWKKLELKEVGIPCGDDNKARGCKLLLTSRYQQVLREDMGSDPLFELKKLEHEEARRLFESRVGNRVLEPDFEPLVDGVVWNCGGLPILIVTLAQRLEHRDLTAWRNALTDIQGSDVEPLVKLNYNDLNDERIKSLFLVCALNSGRIWLNNALVYGMGLGLYGNFSTTIAKARDRLIEDLNTLQRYSLLDRDGKKWFRMHDLFVDVAISIASTKWNALVGREGDVFKKWSEDELRNCKAISLDRVGIEELPEKLDCPNLKILLLTEHNPSLKIPQSFFESMEKLQVMDITGLSFTSLPSSIEFLENLKSLNLDGCNLEDVTLLGKLKGLQFLSFLESTIARLPKEIGGLRELRFLDLKRCTRLKVIEPGVLGSLVNLEELYIDPFCQWEAEGEESRSNASLAELKNMKKLRTLCITIPHSTNLSSDLPFGNLNEHKIQIGDTVGWWGENKESRTLKIKLDSSNLLREVCMQECLGRTQNLYLDGLQDGKDSIHDLCTKGFQELKHLHVKNNSLFQYVVDSTHSLAFTRLESLVLENLNKLEKICRGCLAPGSFSKLKIVKVEDCSEIKHLFHLSMMRNFLQLEEIEITRCHSTQQIVADAEADEYVDETNDDANAKSFKLHRLTLQNLPEMTCFYQTGDHSVILLDGQQVSLPRLESLTLSELSKLEEIWNSQFPSDVTNLKFLKVEDCAFLLSIFPSNLVIRLQNLEAISVERCQLIREVFDLEGLTASGIVEILSQLTTITLSDLPKLGHVWNKNPRVALCFRNLRALKVRNCENLRFLFSSSMAKTLQQIKEIEIASCELLEEIIDVEEEESKEVASIDTLEFPMLTSLYLEELPNLRTFAYGMYRIHCPTLTRLRISGCPKMMTFSSFEGKQQLMTTDTGLQQASVGVSSSLPLPAFFNQNVLFPCLEKLALASCGLMKMWHKELSEESFCKLQSIMVRDCENLSHIFPSTLTERFQSLKMIAVAKCSSLEALIEHVAVNTKKMQKRVVFLELEEVKLWDLPRMNALVPSSTEATLSLPSLTNVSLRSCHSLRYLFTSGTSRTLGKLEKLDVSGCDNMQEVVAPEESEERKLKAVKFSYLCTLKLCSLKSLISFSSGSCAYEFPSLRKLSILECNELKAFIRRPPSVEMINEGSAGFDESPYALFDEKVSFPCVEELTLATCGLMKIWHNELSKESFCKLQSISVQDCENLSHIFSSTIIERFRSLKMIEVLKCTSLEALMEHVAVNSEKRQKCLVFLELEKVKLWDLPRLNALVPSSTKAMLSLPSLTDVSLRSCHNLRYLFANDTSRTLDKLEQLDVSCCNSMLEVIAAESEERISTPVKFSHLRKLKLCSLKSLISFSSGSCAFEFPSLRKLSILECTELKAFILRLPESRVETMNEKFAGFDESSHSVFDKKVVFPKLEKLRLIGIQSRELWENMMPDESICQLKVLEVKQCPNLLNVIPSFLGKSLLHCVESLTVEECQHLRNLFTMSMTKSLVQLQYLGVGGCGEMEYIVAREEETPEEAADIIVIPPLVTLYLHNMPKLRSFYQEKCISKWPSLKEFTIEDCKAVKVILGDANCRRPDGGIPMQQPLLLVEKVEFSCMELMKISHMDNVDKIWLGELASNAFTKLNTLVVEYCQKLSTIFSSHTDFTRFQNLEKITVTDCGLLEVLFHIQELNMSGAHSPSTFQLSELILLRLPKMKHVWSGLPQGGDTFGRLRCMKVEDCESLKSLFPNPVAKSMTHLEELVISDCGVEEIIVEEDSVAMNASDLFFPQLTDLRLLELPELRSFYRNSHTSTWPLLKELQVRHCSKMRSFSFDCEFQSCRGTTTSENQPALFSFQKVIPHLEISTLAREDVVMMPQHFIFDNLRDLTLSCYHDENDAFPSDFLLHKFPNLEELVVRCSSFEEIFPEDASGHGGATFCGGPIDVERPLKALGNLKRLDLLKLCNLRRVWKDGSLMVEILKQIEILWVTKCPSLSIVLPSATSFQRLTHLGVADCDGLVHMGTCSAVKSLVHLTLLSLSNCGAMEDVVTDDGNGEEEISFPKLEELILDGLPRLESFSPTDCAFRFPSLERVVIVHCPKMNIFCKGALRTPNLDKLFLSDEDDEWRWEGDLNTTIQTLLT